MRKHFNAGNVWGKVLKAERKNTPNGKLFLNLHIHCPGAQGNIHAYGRLWKEDLIDALEKAIQEDPLGIFRFRGVFSQYIQGNELPNYSFFDWQVVPKDTPLRAAFILVGEALELKYNAQQDCAELSMKVIREGQAGYSDSVEEFTLITREPDQELTQICGGEIVEIKGFLQQGSGEDEFGGSGGKVRPIIKKFAKVNPS